MGITMLLSHGTTYFSSDPSCQVTHPLETYLMINYWTSCLRSR